MIKKQLQSEETLGKIEEARKEAREIVEAENTSTIPLIHDYLLLGGKMFASLISKISYVAGGILMTDAAFLAAGVGVSLVSLVTPLAIGIPIVTLACKEIFKWKKVSFLKPIAGLYDLTGSMGKMLALVSSVALAVLVDPMFLIATGLLALSLKRDISRYLHPRVQNRSGEFIPGARVSEISV